MIPRDDRSAGGASSSLLQASAATKNFTPGATHDKESPQGERARRAQGCEAPVRLQQPRARAKRVRTKKARSAKRTRAKRARTIKAVRRTNTRVQRTQARSASCKQAQQEGRPRAERKESPRAKARERKRTRASIYLRSYYY